MKYLLSEWRKLRGRFAKGNFLIFLDYDGTLAPIAKTPERAVLSPKAREILEKLVSSSRCKVAIVSGRSLADIKRRVGVKGILYVGNHGLEIEGPRIKHKIFTDPKYLSILAGIRDKLAGELSGINGVIVEDKGLTLALHYRMVRDDLRLKVQTAFHESTILPAVKNQIKKRSGKMVLEIHPPINWDKGKAVLWLLARWKYLFSGRGVLPVYLGDDLTDEDAFRALKNKGITGRVGKAGSSAAGYYLRDHREVLKFLEGVVDLLEAS